MTTKRRWLLYGANGFTGALVAEAAVQRGHEPVLAGRSAEKVRPIADRLGLRWASFALDDISTIVAALSDVDLVLHAAGPFSRTSEPMLTACLERGAHYLDITAELPVFAATLDRDAEARRRGVALVGGVGFDVVPTDCLAKHVADKLPDARFLEIAFALPSSTSAGTTKTVFEMMQRGNFTRLEGALVPAPFGGDLRAFTFSDRRRDAVSVPWGDLETAYKSTGIPNITVFCAVPSPLARALRLFGPSLTTAMKSDRLREVAQRLAGRTVHGPDEARRGRDRSYFYACARNAEGKTAEAWLETMEAYAFTAQSAVLAVERVLADNPVGALTPSLAFGADFVLSIQGSARMDELPAPRPHPEVSRPR
jgi:short subunit dehydrogenase-like uncharacterized protein